MTATCETHGLHKVVCKLRLRRPVQSQDCWEILRSYMFSCNNSSLPMARDSTVSLVRLNGEVEKLSTVTFKLKSRDMINERMCLRFKFCFVTESRICRRLCSTMDKMAVDIARPKETSDPVFSTTSTTIHIKWNLPSDLSSYFMSNLLYHITVGHPRGRKEVFTVVSNETIIENLLPHNIYEVCITPDFNISSTSEGPTTCKRISTIQAAPYRVHGFRAGSLELTNTNSNTSTVQIYLEPVPVRYKAADDTRFEIRNNLTGARHELLIDACTHTEILPTFSVPVSFQINATNAYGSKIGPPLIVLPIGYNQEISDSAHSINGSKLTITWASEVTDGHFLISYVYANDYGLNDKCVERRELIIPADEREWTISLEQKLGQIYLAYVDANNASSGLSSVKEKNIGIASVTGNKAEWATPALAIISALMGFTILAGISYLCCRRVKEYRKVPEVLFPAD